VVNVTKLTEQYIAEHPFVRYCLKRGLINYSSLTRQICHDLSLNVKKNFDAVLIACRRFYNKIKKEPVLDKKILDILRDSKVEIKNKVTTVVLEKNIMVSNLLYIEKEANSLMETFHIVESASVITIITSNELSKKIKKIFKNKIIRENKNLVEIILKSTKQIVTIPGVISYLSSLLSQNNINIHEILSFWTDTIILIDEKDLNKTMELLRF